MNGNELKPAPAELNRVVKWTEGKDKPADGWYTEGDFTDYHSKDTIFLFGENFADNYINKGSRSSSGGQASVAGKYDWHNKGKFLAYGITTVSHYGGYDISNFDGYKKLIDREFAVLEKFVMYGGKVIIPYKNDGNVNLGTKIAALDTTYTEYYQYLQSKVNELIKKGKEAVSVKSKSGSPMNSLDSVLRAHKEKVLSQYQVTRPTGQASGAVDIKKSNSTKSDHNSIKVAPYVFSIFLIIVGIACVASSLLLRFEWVEHKLGVRWKLFGGIVGVLGCVIGVCCLVGLLCVLQR